ncbi:class II aldolase/adducin family protein [Anaerobiospirillum thomasii]|uniref:L-fuculose phosphate aldolase n=1 Tax=Anaerobiospirillum thomasii TaxID=179995 RepID=A0A2X0WTY7_9GAMM|nr:class II aldolase/adducin family protein [Anaerobiospirillum thomasii]SPT68931.1 L-fuculose phosphate aldolase [Anaerobiospirillum thomasii]
MSIEQLSQEIISVCRLLRQNKLVNATHGNISARYGDIMLITPTGSDFYTIEQEDLVRMNIISGEIISKGHPSKEYDLHLLAYRKRPDINAVIHAHSPNSVAVSCHKEVTNLDSIVPAYTLSFAIYTKHLPMVGYFKAGSMELAEKATDKLIGNNAVVLQHHGIIVVSDSVMKGLYRLEEIEENSEIALKIGFDSKSMDPDSL